MPTALFATHHLSPFGPGAAEAADVHYLHPSKHLYMISEHDYVHSLIPSRDFCAQPAPNRIPSRRIGGLENHHRTTRKEPRPLMTTLAYSPDAMGAPGSPPDLTNSKSSKSSSSFHSSGLSDIMGPSDLSHFEDINLDDSHGPHTFPMPLPSPNRLLFESSRGSVSSTRSSPHPAQPSFRDLTSGAKPRYPSLKAAVNSASRSHSQLQAPGKQVRRGLVSSPSAPSLPHLTAPARRSRSPSPGKPQGPQFTSAPRTLSRKSSTRTLETSPVSMGPRRQSWQNGVRKTAKEREAECDDEDDEVPEDAFMWNVPISPRPVQERSPAPSSCGSPPTSRPLSLKDGASSSSAKTSPASSNHRFPQPPSPNSERESFPPALERQRTWEETYTTLDADAKKLTEALEEYQTEIEHQEEIKRQQPGLSRSASLTSVESKPKAVPLPPIRKSDPLIDPFQPSEEKTKYLSRTRPSWLPPKDPKEEKKHLKEYQKMLARIEETERLEAQRQEQEAIAREKAERVKAEYWSTLLLPNWDVEMSNPELKGSHRKMWWNGIPPKLRGTIWQRAIGNELGTAEVTYKVALEKAEAEIKELGQAALNGRYAQIVENTKSVFPELKMFAPQTETSPEQPLHQELVNICVAYSSYRPDVDTTTGVHHIAALFLLNMGAAESFVTLANVLNRALPLSFLVRDQTSIHAAYDTTLSALLKKNHSLSQRLAKLRVEPRDYLFQMFNSLFCDRLSIEHAARIMDVYAIEGDKIPPRVALGLLGVLEGACMAGDAEDVTKVLREKTIRETPDEFMGKVYEAGKSS